MKKHKKEKVKNSGKEKMKMTKCMRFIILFAVLSILTTPVFCREIKAEQIQATMKENSKDKESTDKKSNENVKDTESDDNKDNKENVKDTENDDKDKCVSTIEINERQNGSIVARFNEDSNYDGLIDVPSFTIFGPDNYTCTVDSSVESVKNEYLDMYCYWIDRDYVQFDIEYIEKGKWKFESSSPCQYEIKFGWILPK